MMTAIGIDLGGNNIKGVLLNEEGEVLHEALQSTTQHPSDSLSDDQQWKRSVANMVSELKSKSPSPVKAIGLAAPGLPNEGNTAIRVMPERLKGIENLEWASYLHEEEVWVINDAHAAVMAEAKFGTGKGINNLVMLTLGTGVGGGIIINGELYQGNYQMAGHLGHMTLDINKEDPGITGMPGTLESAMGEDTVSKRSFGRFHSTPELVAAYQRGEPFATYVWLDAVRKLALGLCSLCNLLSPDLIILGGGITKAGKSLYRPLADFMDVYEWKNVGKKILVEQAHYHDKAGAVGAAAFAFSRTPSRPIPDLRNKNLTEK
jgi:glucokinase